MPARTPLTAYGNVRVGPTAMAFVRTAYFLRRHFCSYRNLVSPNKSMKAEQEGAFFLSESGEKNRTGWVGLSVTSFATNSITAEMPTPNGWVVKACLYASTTEMPSPDGLFGLSMKNQAIRPGNHKAIIGNAISINKRSKSVSTNGITPLKIVVKLTSCTTLLMTNTFMPTGG
jgi:hypothetical protein